jgi:hypothetical protein
MSRGMAFLVMTKFLLILWQTKGVCCVNNRKRKDREFWKSSVFFRSNYMACFFFACLKISISPCHPGGIDSRDSSCTSVFWTSVHSRMTPWVCAEGSRATHFSLTKWRWEYYKFVSSLLTYCFGETISKGVTARFFFTYLLFLWNNK